MAPKLSIFQKYSNFYHLKNYKRAKIFCKKYSKPLITEFRGADVLKPWLKDTRFQK